MSPTVFRERNYRFYFFSREESRIHIHVQHPSGEAPFRIEPEIELAENHGMAQHEIALALEMIQEHEHEIRAAWARHFPG